MDSDWDEFLAEAKKQQAENSLQQRIDMSRIVEAQFYGGEKQALAAARYVAEQDVPQKISRGEWVPDHVAIEEEAKKLHGKAMEIIRDGTAAKMEDCNAPRDVRAGRAVAAGVTEKIYTALWCYGFATDAIRRGHKRSINIKTISKELDRRLAVKIADFASRWECGEAEKRGDNGMLFVPGVGE